MPVLPRSRLRQSVLAAALFGLTSSGVAVWAADAVIFPDGFTVQGRHFKESALAMDNPGQPIRLAKASGFDVVEDGPKWVVFSSHAQKGGRIEKGVESPTRTAYTRKLPIVGRLGLPPFDKVTEQPFGDNWQRTLVLHHPSGGVNNCRQIITHLDPNTLGIQSSTHAWRMTYHTGEWDPKEIRRLLGTHPDLADVGGKAVPDRRMNIAAFLKDAGWVYLAREELAKLRKDLPGAWPQEAEQRFATLQEDVDRAEARLFIEELEAALGAGRYQAAKQLLASYTPRVLDAKDTTRLAVVKAQLEPILAKYDLTTRLLRGVIDRETGAQAFLAHATAAGGGAALYYPRPKLPPQTAALIAAAETILSELHPDTVSRVELFTSLAERQAGTTKSTELLALLVTGWLKGKNGAETNPESALRYWAAREMVFRYLSADIRNERITNLDNYLATTKPLAPDELAQMVTLLPPAYPEDLAKRSGELVPPVEVGGVDGIYRRQTPGTTEHPRGHEYFLWLPPEYHHGRPYPVILALNSPQVTTERMVAMLAPYASRHGYIVAAPAWTNQFTQTQYDYTGKSHPIVTDTLRDVVRHFQVNPDKVFLYGYADGADFALDIGMAKPDLFAGVVAVGPNPPPQLYVEYWRNTQKLPVYMVTGELSGAFINIRRLYEKWTVNGYPALLTVYKGRGAEWFPMEQPRVFDWLGRKTRARGTASLRLNQARFEPWQVLREGESRFYFVGVPEDGLAQPGWVPGRVPTPARFRADVGKGGVVNIDLAIGVRKFVIWLERDLLDWTKPIRVNVNGSPAVGYRPQVLQPDLRLMLEELYRTGDRKMLYFGKIEVPGPG